MIKRLLVGVIAVALLLLLGCGADARHEIYRVHEGRNGNWTLEVRRWVEYRGSMLLPNNLTYMDGETYTYVTWRLEYHGAGDIEDCHIASLEVNAQNVDWGKGSESGEINYYDFENGWTDKDHSSGIEIYDYEECYAMLTDTDGNTIRIDAPLAKSKGDKY